ncbi:hypothetical protein SELMODRAFT_414445 [Selaginella moellendorffii]|uniref:CBM20 domain-containing protein n=1 Tax=Selaginella moellendorffii TaxID=88036 RepID=D8RST0_SELML|nr:phosphoglucan, water dikinase, chloroplastic isoform X1 [Selaginella moellendorffii]EFJ25125.1 hypothetical protein SELMODRAFT_414445 [Selaginella moellendorffii]|eukprot:XP_002974170.1 phosphoglucan, water dikinase, chloroplastic isoform X1 [Selaginella moellendorffii]
MEKFAAALGVSHRPLVWQQLVGGAVSGSRDSRQGFLQCSCFERRILRHRKAARVLAPRAARLVLTTASESDDAAVEESEEVMPMVTTTFMLQKKCDYGERFAVVGASPLLGAWDPAAGVSMDWSEDHVWKCQIDLPVGEQYEYKFVLTSKKAVPEWQPGPNRIFKTDDAESPLIVSESWESTETGPSLETGDAPETLSKLVEDILEESTASAVVEDVLDAAADTVSKLVNEALDKAGENVPELDKTAGGKGVDGTGIVEKEEAGAAAKVAEESEPEKGSKDEQSTNQGKKSVVTFDNMEEDESPDSESSKDTSSESSEEEEGHSASLAVVTPQPECTSDVPEDSKGFKSFKFEAQPATGTKTDHQAENWSA